MFDFINVELTANDFINRYPQNILDSIDGDKKHEIMISLTGDIVKKYIKIWERDADIVIISYTNANVKKINDAIQDNLDTENKREIPANRDEIKFYTGDRCVLDKPIELFTVIEKDGVAHLGTSLELMLYNGEIFDILNAKDVEIKTNLNRYKYNVQTFNGQILSIRKINYDDTIYKVLYIPYKRLSVAKENIRKNEGKFTYLNVMSDYIKKFPSLNYGYAITLYKAQGSEWRNVIINLNSIYYSCLGRQQDSENKRMLLRSTYTAITRCSENLHLFWFDK